MILTHETIKADIDISPEKINIWVIESKHLLNSFIRELISQKDGDDGSFVLSDDNEILRIKDHIDVVADFFDIDHNSKKIQSRMIKVLEKFAEDDLFKETADLRNQLRIYLEDLMDAADIDAVYDELIDISDILKLCDVKFDVSYSTLLESIIEYLRICDKLFEKHCYVFVNLSYYMEHDEVLELYKFIQYEKVHVLFIENTMKDEYRDKNCIILDSDFCII